MATPAAGTVSFCKILSACTIMIESFCFKEKLYLVFQQKIINLTTGLNAARATTKLVFIDTDKMAGDIPAEILSKI